MVRFALVDRPCGMADFAAVSGQDDMAHTGRLHANDREPPKVNQRFSDKRCIFGGQWH